MTVTLCLSCSLVLLNRRPRAHSSGPKGPFGLMWLSLPHFVYNSVRSSTQLPQARRTQLNYIIVRRPLDFWNRMFNRHQAEISVMQFRGHSLPVHHSVVYHRNYLVSFHQQISARAISSPNCHWNVSLPSGASPWNSIFFGPGRRSKHNRTTVSHPYVWRLLMRNSAIEINLSQVFKTYHSSIGSTRGVFCWGRSSGPCVWKISSSSHTKLTKVGGKCIRWFSSDLRVLSFLLKWGTRPCK